jgi:hypothetical protein
VTTIAEQHRRAVQDFDDLQAAYLDAARGAPYVTPAIEFAASALHAAEQEMMRLHRLKAYQDQQRALGRRWRAA